MNDAVRNPYEQDLDQVPANYVPLSPLSMLARAAAVYPQRLAVVHGTRRFSWMETFTRCRRLASALSQARHRQGRYGGGDRNQYPGVL